jgi:mannose-1-phosphate guanylyltransferase
MSHKYCVIMAGGVGSRFWPMSRNDKPKQFLDILGTGESLIQMTYNRFKDDIPAENIFVVTHEAYTDLVKQHLPEIPDDNILKEPSRKNTAPCIAYACYKIGEKDKNAKIVITPADHLVTKEKAFSDAINNCLNYIDNNKNALLTIGIKPTRPDTGYGYIQYDVNAVSKIKKVVRFTEKPVLEKAKEFVQQGDYLWNGGIFVWSFEGFSKAFENYQPVLNTAFKNINYHHPNAAKQIEEVYSTCESISIDYALMEKSSDVYVFPGDLGWSDLGTWGSLYENANKDENQNVINGNLVKLYNCQNNIVKVNNEKVLIIEGLDGYIIAEDANLMIICPLENEQKIKEFVSDLQDSGLKNIL